MTYVNFSKLLIEIDLLKIVYEMNIDFFQMLCWKHALFKIQKMIWANMMFIVDNVSKIMKMYNL
jgi:hypothetical protein